MSYVAIHQSKPLFLIPTQTLNLYKLFALHDKQSTFIIKQFEISEQVTYKEYKEYLASVKKDSSEKFYLTQLPDSSIGSLEVYQKYLTLPDYDNDPVIGISWEGAMNFCKWKTIKDNDKHLKFVYRLPNCSEWLAAYYYLKENKIKNTLNKNYSDWLINLKDESNLFFDMNAMSKTFIYDGIYFHKLNDSMTLKRKRVIGNSYLYQQAYLLEHSFSFYANQGYRQVSFRYVKEVITGSDKLTLGYEIIHHWGLAK